MALKAKKPQVVEKRLKMLLFGPAGVGKTLASLQFPNAYVMDLEKGTDFYQDTIAKNKSVILQTINPDEIKEELKELLTTKHDFKTLVVDPVTQLYNATQEKWVRIFEKHAGDTKDREVQDFGMRYWQRVKSDFKSIQRIILALDMNVIITSHQKDVFNSQFQKIGVSWDTMKGDEYIFDLIFRLDNVNGKRMAVTIKERAEIGKQKFPESFEWSYANFLKYYGDVIEKENVPVKMATQAQVLWLNELIEVVKVDEETVQKWLTKAGVDSFEEFTYDQIDKSIKFLADKVKDIMSKEGDK